MRGEIKKIEEELSCQFSLGILTYKDIAEIVMSKKEYAAAVVLFTHLMLIPMMNEKKVSEFLTNFARKNKKINKLKARLSASNEMTKKEGGGGRKMSKKCINLRCNIRTNNPDGECAGCKALRAYDLSGKIKNKEVK